MSEAEKKMKPGGCGHVIATEILIKNQKTLDEFNERIDELLAKCAHDIWCHWMQYMFEHGGEAKPILTRITRGTWHKVDLDTLEKRWSMHQEKEDRWRQQMNTEYEALSEEEKTSDREIAEKFIKPMLREILSPPRIPL